MCRIRKTRCSSTKRRLPRNSPANSGMLKTPVLTRLALVNPPLLAGRSFSFTAKRLEEVGLVWDARRPSA